MLPPGIYLPPPFFECQPLPKGGEHGRSATTLAREPRQRHCRRERRPRAIERDGCTRGDGDGDGDGDGEGPRRGVGGGVEEDGRHNPPAGDPDGEPRQPRACGGGGDGKVGARGLSPARGRPSIRILECKITKEKLRGEPHLQHTSKSCKNCFSEYNFFK